MPDTTLSDALKEACASAPSDDVVFETVELSHPAVETPVRLCKTLEDMTLGLENDLGDVLFTACPFTLKRPSSGENGSQELALAIANTSREISDFIYAALSEEAPVEIIYRIYRSQDLTQPQNGSGLRLFLYDVVLTAAEATGRASFAEIINRRWPLANAVYSKTRFPALNT